MNSNVARMELIKNAAGPTLSPSIIAKFRERAGAGGDFEGARADAFGVYGARSFIDPTDELWRYTKPSQFKFDLLANPDAHRTVTLSLGEFCGESNTAPVTVERMNTGFEKVRGLVDRTVLGSVKARQSVLSDAEIALHLACISSAWVIRVPRGAQIEKPISVNFEMGSPGTVAAPLVLVLVEQGASVQFVEDIKGECGLYAPWIEIVVGDGASCDWLSLQRLSDASSYRGRIRTLCGRDARHRCSTISLGGTVSRQELECIMLEPGGSADMRGIYCVDGNQHVDFHPSQVHLAPHCRTDLYCKGALKDTSRSVYFGLIQVDEVAQKTDAYQKSRNLLLSPDARADAIPNLEIRANDVKCSHGASVGQANAEELFYVMSRGLSRKVAERLLVEGFFADILSTISPQPLRDHVYGEVIAKLDR